jgi:hypothetical protein
MRPQLGGSEGLITGTLAVVLLVAEGIQQTLQLLPRWTKYRSAHSALRRERLLFEGSAGPYAQVGTPVALFTERINSIISEENAAWLTIHVVEVFWQQLDEETAAFAREPDPTWQERERFNLEEFTERLDRSFAGREALVNEAMLPSTRKLSADGRFAGTDAY